MMDNLDMNRIPEHIAIIMDGNGRWAIPNIGKVPKALLKHPSVPACCNFAL